MQVRKVKANSIARHIKSCSSCPAHWTPLKNLTAILEDQASALRAFIRRAYPGVSKRWICRPHRTAAPKRRRAKASAKASTKPTGVWQRSFGRCPGNKQDPRRCYIKDLCEDGDVEPNPRPGSLPLQLLTWNAQGFNHLVQGLHLNLFEGCDVIAIQEANLTQLNRTEVACMCERKGFHAYFRAAPESLDARQTPVCRGGLVTLVRHGLPSHRVRDAAVEGMYEFLTVRVGCWQVHNAHRKPSSAPAGYEDAVQELMSAPDPAVVLGDHNIDFSEFSFEGTSHAAVDDQGLPLPTRVGGSRCIDFLLCKPVGVANTLRREATLGDHYMITASAQPDSSCHSVETLWRARPTTCYNLPTGVSRPEWTKAQAVYWQAVELPPNRGDTEAEWTWFNRQAEAIMRQATMDCGSQPRDPPGRRHKGTAYALTQHVKQTSRGSECHSFAVRRLLKLQGRLREWQRQEAARRDTTGVQLAVQRSWPRALGPLELNDGVVHLLDTVAEALAATQHRKTREDVSRWQRQMAERGKAATRWLKGKQIPALRIAPHDWRPEDAIPPLSVSDSLINLRNFWRTIWVRQGCDHAAAVARWRLFGRRARFSGCPSSLLSPEALQRAAQQKDHGAAGPDGWSGSEISSWPRDAWQVYAQLLHRWMKRASFPSSCQQLRQAHIPKDSFAPSADHQVKADELRPIAVLSILWRVVSSAVARHAHTQEWVSQVVESAQYGGIHARHLHQGLGQLATPFQSGAVITALDLQKCFDYVEPRLVCAVLREAGFPSSLLAALEHVWTQERFIEVGGYVSPSSEHVSAAMPQGDALAPLALNILLSAPSRDLAVVASSLPLRVFSWMTVRMPLQRKMFLASLSCGRAGPPASGYEKIDASRRWSHAVKLPGTSCATLGLVTCSRAVCAF